jgi:hypothetical protein
MSTPAEVELTLLERYVQLTELTSEELIARGERLVRLGQQLAVMGMGSLPPELAPEPRSVGRLGVVNEATAIQVARRLGAFDRGAFAEALGLRQGGTSRWLAKLLEHSPPIIERREDGTYAYIPPPSSKAPQRRAAPETLLVDQSPARGQPIPVAPVKRAERADSRAMSRPGRAHRVRQAQKRFDQMNGGDPAK